jgi:hypothetical protein
MPDLQFAVESVAVEPYAVAPLLLFKLCVTNRDTGRQPIHSVLLSCQVRIEPAQRGYSPPEQQGLNELFGPPEQWSRSLASMLWTHTQVIVPAFTTSATVNLPVPCSFDLSIAVTKYFDGLQQGEVPLLLLFSGTVFYAAPHAPLQAAPIAWDREATFRLPVKLWKNLMQRYYPNSAWLCLRRDVVDRLQQYKLRSGSLTWEQTLERLLAAATARAAETGELGAPA